MTEGASPFEVRPPSLDFARELHGFRWLRHLRAAGHELAFANARALVGDWIRNCRGGSDPVAWESEVVARRVIAWFSHSPIVLRDADPAFYRRFMKSLASQVRFLRQIAASAPDGETRLRARIAIAFASLVMPSSQGSMRSAAESARRRDRAADSAGRGACLAESPGDPRSPRRFAAAQTNLPQSRLRPACPPDTCDRPHVPGTALLSPCRRRTGTVQRSWRDPGKGNEPDTASRRDVRSALPSFAAPEIPASFCRTHDDHRGYRGAAAGSALATCTCRLSLVRDVVGVSSAHRQFGRTCPWRAGNRHVCAIDCGAFDRGPRKHVVQPPVSLEVSRPIAWRRRARGSHPHERRPGRVARLHGRPRRISR